MTHPLSARLKATQATVDAFQGQAFAWGACDCVTLAACHLLHLGRPVDLSPAGAYRSLPGAIKALRRVGFDGLEAAVDGQGLTRIAPAFARPGDLVAMPGERRMPALTVALPNGRLLGFQHGVGAVLAPAVAPLIAWSVD